MSLIDYTTLTKLDPNSRFVVAANKVTINGLTRNEDARLNKDYGAGFLTGDFIHYHSSLTNGSSTNSSVCYVWLWSNDDDDARWILTNSECLNLGLVKSGASVNIQLQEFSGGGGTALDSFGGSLGVQYWYVIERIGNTITCEAYTDAARTVIVDTLSITQTSAWVFRYGYAINNFNDGLTNGFNGFIEDLDFGIADEVAGNINRKLGRGLTRGLGRGL
jgi:hypothetical protein